MIENSGSPKSIDFKAFLESYHLALGAFVDQFSQIENLVQMALCCSAGVTGATAKAVFSGIRTDVACSHIRRIFEANGDALPEPIDRVFVQLALISAVRNSVLHHGYRIYADLRQFTSNERTAMPNKAKEYPISPEILGQMTEDLRVMSFALVPYIAGFNPPLPDEMTSRFEAISRTPWQYKPPSQPPAHKKSSQSSAAHRSQPEPSQE